MSDGVRSFLQEKASDPSRLDAQTLLEAIRISAEGVSRVATQGAEHSRHLKEISETLHNMDKRLALLENGGVSTKVDDHERRIALLEAAENVRKGALGLGGWMVKNWPAIIGYIGLIVVLIEKGVVRV